MTTSGPAAGSGRSYYDAAGHGYADRRRPDPRIERQILRALGDAASVLNVGAGTGSYEPGDRQVVAVEPSPTMIRQRTTDSPCVRAVAEALPFRDGRFDAATAILTIHHWPDWRRGVSELLRVARRAVILTCDPEAMPRFWLMDYFPGIVERDRERMPPVAAVQEYLGGAVETVPIPHDCADGFLGAYWRSPEQYLDADVRAGISAFAMLTDPERERGLAQLHRDLASGEWAVRYGSVLEAESLDIGYRLIVSGGG